MIKRFILISVVLIFSFLTTNMVFAAANTWTQKANFGGIIRIAAVGFSIGNKGYMGTGNMSSNPFKDFWEYDPTTNTWTQKADFGGVERSGAVGFSIENKGYVGTGYDYYGDTYKKDFWEYDPTTNTWTQKADFGGVKRAFAVGFSIENKGYVGTGYTNYDLKKDFWEYDPTTNTWTQKADFGGEVRQAAVGFSIGSKGYIGTGQRLGSALSYRDFWEYDPSNNTWKQKANFGGVGRESAVGFSIGSKGYIGTGYYYDTDLLTTLSLKDFWEYDQTTNTWTQKANFGGGMRHAAVGFSIGSKGYIGTGYDYSSSTIYKDLWEYEPHDTTPDQFMFTDQVGVTTSTVITSNAVTVSGINVAAPISITGGTYSINGGAYTSASGMVSNGNTVTVQQTSSGSYSITTNAILTIGGVSDTFSVTTQNVSDDTTPNQFIFTDQTGVDIGVLVTSDVITVSGLGTAAPISITGGTYSINGGAYTSASGTVSNGNTVTVQQTSSGSYSTTTNATLTIGGVSDTFSVTTQNVSDDTTPNQFIFTDQTGVDIGVLVTSDVITVSGLGTAAPISITGGTYSINGGAYTSASGMVSNGNTVTVQQTSSGSYSTTTNATLTIGGVSDTFSVTTQNEPADDTPDQFTFIDLTNVALNSIIEASIIVSGITAPTPISIVGSIYCINGGVWTNGNRTVNNGDIVTVRNYSSASYSTTTNVTLTIGGVSDTFSVTTAALDTTPDAFSFTDQTGVALSTVNTSNSITVSGITGAAPISITGGTYSINGGAYTSAAGTVNNGNTVTVHLTSSGSYSTTTEATLTIGGVSDTFSVTTINDTTPETFTFTDQTGVSLNTVTTSNVITVSGINTPAAISITGGEYSVSTDGGVTWSAYSTTTPSTVSLNNQVRVRQTSSSSVSTTTNTTLTIGGVSDTFSVTTINDTTPETFTFTDQTGVSLNTVITSNVITVSGITAPAAISITGGEYSVSTDGGATWSAYSTTTPSTVSLNNQVRVRQTSSSSVSTTTNTTLTIGSISDTFSVTTKSASALGTITVIPLPASLNASWTLTGPNSYSFSYSDSSGSDATIGSLEPGSYTVTWGNVTGWDKPASRTQTLAAGESITFTGNYQLTPVIPTPPTSGTQGSNITINGSNFGATQGSGYVDFNGIHGTIVSWSNTQIVVTVPYGATLGCMRIVTDYGTSGCMNFSVDNPACFPPAKLSSTEYFNIAQDAYDNVTDGNAVLLQAGTLSENVTFDRNITTTLKGGYNCPYDSQSSYTTIDGSLTIKNGTVTVEKLIIK